MTKLPYLRTMFATCMLFQVIYVLCALLWLIYPGLKGQLPTARDLPKLYIVDRWKLHLWVIASGVYGWIVAIIFVFFYNLWPSVLAAFAQRAVVR
jgi:hypothetical protein